MPEAKGLNGEVLNFLSFQYFFKMFYKTAIDRTFIYATLCINKYILIKYTPGAKLHLFHVLSILSVHHNIFFIRSLYCVLFAISMVYWFSVKEHFCLL